MQPQDDAQQRIDVSFERSPQVADRIVESHESHLTFNVMAGRPVTETMHVREYRFEGDRLIAAFDREYHSSMKASPTHLIFLSAMIHTQKLIYMALCRRFGRSYEADGPEQLKIWPTWVDCAIPERIEAEEGLEQDLRIESLREVRKNSYRIEVESRIGSMRVRAKCAVFLLPAPGGAEA